MCRPRRETARFRTPPCKIPKKCVRSGSENRSPERPARRCRLVHPANRSSSNLRPKGHRLIALWRAAALFLFPSQNTHCPTALPSARRFLSIAAHRRPTNCAPERAEMARSGGGRDVAFVRSAIAGGPRGQATRVWLCDGGGRGQNLAAQRTPAAP